MVDMTVYCVFLNIMGSYTNPSVMEAILEDFVFELPVSMHRSFWIPFLPTRDLSHTLTTLSSHLNFDVFIV